MRIVTAILISCLAAVCTFVQAQKTETKTKRPVIRATVTIKGEPNKAPVYPSEDEANIWNEFSFRNDFIKVSLHARIGNLEDSFESVEPDDPILMASAKSKNANYKLMARKIATLNDQSDIDELLEKSIAQAYTGRSWRISKKKDIHYEGILGKELIVIQTVAEGEHLHHIRAYILDSHVVTLMVSPYFDSKMNLEPWINKFFDSLRVKLRARLEV